MNWLCEFLLTVRQRLCLLPRHVTRFFSQSDTWVSGEVSRRIWIPLELAARCGYSHSSVTNSYQLTWNQPAVYSWVAGRMRWCNNDYRLTERRSKKNNFHIICQTHGNVRDCGSNSAHKKVYFSWNICLHHSWWCSYVLWTDFLFRDALQQLFCHFY